MTPLVGVGIPSYNHARFLPAAIESVLAQTLSDVEVAIVDDGSSDNSLEIAEHYAAAHPDRITVATHPGGAHRGIAATGNLCRSRLSARYVLGLPSDDVLYPDALERAAGLLERRAELGLVFGYAHRIDEAGRRIPGSWTFGEDITRGGRAVERLVQGNKIPAMTAMFRRECLEQIGPEDETLTYGDWEFFTRAAAHWEVGFLPRAIAMHRIHGANTSLVVPRETQVDRALEVIAALAERAPRVGGRLAEPRIRATLELQVAFLRFASGEEAAAQRSLTRAFELDPSLTQDGSWMSRWLWDRVLDQLHPASGPEFAPWVAARVAPLLRPRAARTFRRSAAAVHAGERAVRLAGAGRAGAAGRAALLACTRSPRRLADRRLLAVLLDATGDGAASRALLSARRRLRPRR